MLKKILESLDDLDEALHKYYEKKADGKYHLKLENDDAEPLRRARDHEKEQRQEAERKLKEEQDKNKDLEEKLKKNRPSSGNADLDALERSWQEKLDAQKAEQDATIAELRTGLSKQTVESVATEMAAELAGENAFLLLPHIKSRLRPELKEGVPSVRVLSESGEPSAMTVEELQKEFFTSDRFKSIVVTNNASGGGARGGSGGGAGKLKFSEASPAEKVAFKRKHGDEAYRRWRDSGKK